MRASRTLLLVTTATPFIIAPAPSHGDTIWNEAVNGDLSGDRFVPTSLVLSQGTNSILATSVQGDREYVTLTLSAGLQLDSIMLVSYVSNDPLAFIGVQSGTTFTEPPTGANVANLLGWTHFGSNPNTIGTDILDNMGVGAGAMGFTPPLPGGIYTFWIQQTGVNMATYQLDFIVSPAPGAMSLLVLAGLAGGRRRRSSII
jgi:MYXO-CTERM domain-containing protein